MPWQRMIAEVAGEYDPVTKIPYYRTIIVTVERQAGKTTLFVCFQVQRCLSPFWDQPQRSAFTAQTGKDARDKHIDEVYPLLRRSKLAPHIRSINEGMGNERVLWNNGSVMRLLSTGQTTGHGKTLQQAVVDEFWHDVDFAREQGLGPAMITQDHAQMLMCTTAGNARSVMLRAKRSAGRQAVEEGLDRGIAYFEWSAPQRLDPETGKMINWNPETELDLLPTFHPAVCPDPPCRCDPDGKWKHTQSIDTLRAEYQSMRGTPGEFLRAYGNIDAEDNAELWSLIKEDGWRAVLDPEAAPTGALRMSADASHDRSSGGIAIYGGGVVEPVDYRPGVGWMFERLVDMALRLDAEVAIDVAGPIGYMAEDLADRGVRLDRMTGPEVVQSCGRMFDDIADKRVIFAQRGEHWSIMDDAVAGLVQKPAGDRMVWSRERSQNDICLFYAATLAWKPNMPEGAFALFG